MSAVNLVASLEDPLFQPEGGGNPRDEHAFPVEEREERIGRSPTEGELRLERLRAYREQLKEAGHWADRNSLARAADLVALYEAKDWVADVPEPTRPRSRGRPVEPESWSRFAAWVGEQTGLARSTLNQLQRAHEVVSNYVRNAEIIPTSEGVVRPLTRLLKEHAQAIPSVWTDAVALAGGSDPDATVVTLAVKRWKAANPTQRSAQKSYGVWATERRERIVGEARFLIETGHLEELKAAMTEVKRLADLACERRPPR